ncbi:UDP-glycosyltransferase UGT5-like [Phlebotomus argentipes]|uniref:UDP-glycosyltransferase UGT5-like n=1 Tax=Phlebotomus argentipes TaxID=94469 RepID=UPI00289375CA|nr:UDP-glycosyltransferase UGT5-like [Phlebotomus argentipes]
MFRLQAVLGVVIYLHVASSFRILGLFPHAGESHYQIFQPIMKALVEAGHEVTVLSHFPERSNNTGLRVLLIDEQQKSSLLNFIDLSLFENRRPYNHFLEFFMLHEWGVESCRKALGSAALQNLLTSGETFDLIIAEIFNTDCMLAVAHKLNVPVIGLSSCTLQPWHLDRVGIPNLPSYVPALFMPYSEEMSFSQRLANWITLQSFKLGYRLFNDRVANNLVEEYLGPGIPDVGELALKTSLVMVNTHYSLSGTKPLPPSVIEVGGGYLFSQHENTLDSKLDPELKQFLDTADNGVIYISWGSMIRAETLPAEKRDGILQALAMQPQKVLWKWENETIPNKPDNVYFRKWMPQRDILCHPKVRVFMTHGGLLGSSEAAYCGVPAIVTPMYGDQFFNGASLEHRGMGVVLPYEDISKDTVHKALQKALDSSFLANAKKVSYAYKNRPKTPLETAVWWAEHVIKTGGSPLTKSHSVFLPWYIYHSLDVIATLLLGCVILLTAWIWFIRRLLGSNRKQKSTVTHKQKVN